MTDHLGRIEGYAIISEDGMLATADRVMPDSLKFDADTRFFEKGLDSVNVVVHGRYSHEQQQGSARRRRLILTRRIEAIEPHRSNPNALLWNPTGATFEEALVALGTPNADVAIIGGPDVFALFLGRYDAFYLTRAPRVILPGGRPVFPVVPGMTPEAVLERHGMLAGPVESLDAAKGLTMVCWRRPAGERQQPDPLCIAD